MTADVRKGMPDPRIDEEEFDRTFSRAVLRPYNLSVEWLSAREAILEAAARHRELFFRQPHPDHQRIAAQRTQLAPGNRKPIVLPHRNDKELALFDEVHEAATTLAETLTCNRSGER
jgi:hypothetical protein